MNNILYNKQSNCIIIVKTSGFFTFKAFKTIQFIIIKNKQLYKNVWFKKIPKPNHFIFLKDLDIILEFIIVTNIFNILKLMKYITYKILFKLQVIYLKN